MYVYRKFEIIMLLKRWGMMTFDFCGDDDICYAIKKKWETCLDYDYM